MGDIRKQGNRIFYGWIVVLIAFLTMALNYSIRYAYPVFFVALEEQFGWSRTATYFAYTLQLQIYGFMGVIAGAIYDRVGPRVLFPIGATIVFVAMVFCSQLNSLWQLYLFAGVMVPLGTIAIGIVPHTALNNTWFVKKRGLASGLATAGLGVGMGISGLIGQSLISSLGFRWAYAIFGIMVLSVVVPLSLLFQKRRPQDLGLLPDGDRPEAEAQDIPLHKRKKERPKIDAIVDQAWASREWPLREIVRTRRFWVFFAVKFFLVFGVYTVLIHQVHYAVGLGFSKMAAAAAFGITGLVGALGKIIMGHLSDRVGREVTHTLIMILAVSGILTLMSIQDPSQAWKLYTYAVLYGLGYGAIAAILPPMLADVYGVKALGASYGLSVLGSGLGGSLGPLFAAYLYDTTGSYRVAFTTAIVFLVITVGLVWIFAPRKVRLVEGRAQARARKMAPAVAVAGQETVVSSDYAQVSHEREEARVRED
ncbi:MAG: MFS transporter [Candidatus Tectomicrobia bacterium]|uniref:MFS transporter n=1 Tax=Tectimicrobiota bacterium TaxID=2528274 RepID=A0A932FZD9_UNCTE|nr:MFS transporter [Candidatus Tectomicrobia bacterium]